MSTRTFNVGGMTVAEERGAGLDVAAKTTGVVERPVMHSDGVVCRCAVRWREYTLARGLDRVAAEYEDAERAAGGAKA